MITSEDSRHGELIQISDLYLNNVDLTFFYGPDALENTSKKIKLKSDGISSSSYDFENDYPVFIVAEFKSDDEETGFSLSYLRTTILHETDELTKSVDVETEESVSEKADALLD